MDKLPVLILALAVLGLTGCQTLDEMASASRQRRNEYHSRQSAVQQQIDEIGKVNYWLGTYAKPEMLSAAGTQELTQPLFKEMLPTAAAYYRQNVAYLQKLAIYQDGMAVLKRLQNAYSEKIQKARADFTEVEAKAAYDDYVAAATAPGATEDLKKGKLALDKFDAASRTMKFDDVDQGSTCRLVSATQSARSQMWLKGHAYIESFKQPVRDKVKKSLKAQGTSKKKIQKELAKLEFQLSQQYKPLQDELDIVLRYQDLAEAALDQAMNIHEAQKEADRRLNVAR